MFNYQWSRESDILIIIKMVLLNAIFIICMFKLVSSSSQCDVQTIYKSDGDLKIAFILNECSENSTTLQNTIINSAIWATQRLNYLESTPFKVGLNIYQTCSEKEIYNSIFSSFQQDDESYLLGLISIKNLPEKLKSFCNVLNVRCMVKSTYYEDAIRASVNLLEVLNWNHNITVITPDDYILKEFNVLTKIKGICVGRSLILG